MNPFEFVKSINEKTGNLIANDQDMERQYMPFLVNRGLSFTADTILAANEMNSVPFLDKKLQYVSDVLEKWLHCLFKGVCHCVQMCFQMGQCQ